MTFSLSGKVECSKFNLKKTPIIFSWEIRNGQIIPDNEKKIL